MPIWRRRASKWWSSCERLNVAAHPDRTRGAEINRSGYKNIVRPLGMGMAKLVQRKCIMKTMQNKEDVVYQELL